LKFRCIVASALLLACQPIPACTVFFAFDGRLAIAGDNEDFDHPYTQMWIVPHSASSYGVVYFVFGRGQYPAGGASLTGRARQVLAGLIPFADSRIEDSYGLPQQGNEKGLFFGGAATETVVTDPVAQRLPIAGENGPSHDQSGPANQIHVLGVTLTKSASRQSRRHNIVEHPIQ
jgi:hypothetical protein